MNLEPIFTAVRQAAILTREVQRHHIIESQKTGQEPVTIADYGSQAIVCEALSRAFPEDAVLAEESGTQFMMLVEPEQRKQITQLISFVLGRSVTEEEVVNWLDFNKGIDANRTWVIDPIDGTKGFLALRHYVIAVGILEDKNVVGGVMGAPAYPGYEKGALLHAINGEAFIQDMHKGSARRIYASNNSEASTVRVLESVEKSHASHDRMARVRELAGLLEAPFERIDSQEKYGRIAAGDAELYLRLPRINSNRPHSTWDHAPGAALVMAAGGMVTDIDGSPLDFSTGLTLANNQGMIVSNGRIHEKVLNAVQQVLKEEANNPQP
jgi:3'(2'), 5'-bisphosphate nucleotidase